MTIRSEPAGNGYRDPSCRVLEQLGHPMQLQSISYSLFTPASELADEGWPDFSLTELADWKSSQTPKPNDWASDCCLVLTFPKVLHSVKNGSEWRYLAFATGGIWEEVRKAVVMPLPLSPGGAEIALAIARRWAASNLSAEYASFDQLQEYRGALNAVGLDCNDHILSLAEGFYPVDMSEEAFEILTGAAPPSVADAYLNHGAMALAILAPNCAGD